MDIEQHIINAAISEIQHKSWGVTEQYMEIHDVVRVDGIPKVARVNMNGENNAAVVYFPVEGVKFYLTIHIEKGNDFPVVGVDFENDNVVYFRASSDLLNVGQLNLMTSLKPTESWNIGDLKFRSGVLHSDSCIIFEPNPEPDSFENKLYKLLDYLEKDRAGIIALANKATGYIAVDSEIYINNGNIHGPYINPKSLKRMADLKLSIQFYQWVSGNPIK